MTDPLGAASHKRAAAIQLEMVAHDRISSDVMWSRSSLKMNVSVTGLPGKSPETLAVTTVWLAPPNRLDWLDRVAILLLCLGPPRRDGTQTLERTAFIPDRGVHGKACGKGDQAVRLSTRRFRTSRPSPIPLSAQRAHSQGGRTLARGRIASFDWDLDRARTLHHQLSKLMGREEDLIRSLGRAPRVDGAPTPACVARREADQKPARLALARRSAGRPGVPLTTSLNRVQCR